MRVTIAKPNVFNPYGILLPNGSIQTVDATFGASLVYSLQALDTDGVLPGASNNPFSTTTATPASAVALALKKHPFMPAGIANVQAVMVTPPTVAINTVNPLAAGLRFSPYDNANSVDGSGSVSLSFCSISRGGNPVIVGPSANQTVKFDHVSATPNAASYAGGNLIQVGVMHYGTTIVLALWGRGNNITAKVNDQYVSLTPTACPANGVMNYYSLTFGSAALRRIDFIAGNTFNSFFFGGFYVSATDTLYPAQIRGPRIMIMGDSYCTDTGAPANGLGFPGVFAEYMGFDDVWQSGIGGTGLIANGSGSYCTYGQRAASDIYPFAPDEVIIQGFFNDNGFSGAQVQAALTSLIAGIQANLPNTRVTVFGPCVNSGSGNHTGGSSANGFNAERAACTAVVASFASPLVRYIDPTTGPAPVKPQILQLTTAVSANATAFTCLNIGFASEGTTYQWPNGERSFVISRSGYTATVDRIASAWPIGTVLTQVGNCYMRGAGFQGTPTGVGNADLLVYTDDVHPSPLGHLALGLQLAESYAASLNL